MSEKGLNNLVQIGQVLKSNGNDGEILVGFRSIEPEDIDLKEPVFIYFDGLPVPFFILSLTKRGNTKALIRMNDIDNQTDADEISGKGIFVDKDSLEIYDEEEPDITGWTILDKKGKTIGKITDYEEIPGNPCIYVQHKDDNIMIPFNENLILSVDEENMTISMIIPEGLL